MFEHKCQKMKACIFSHFSIATPKNVCCLKKMKQSKLLFFNQGATSSLIKLLNVSNLPEFNAEQVDVYIFRAIISLQ